MTGKTWGSAVNIAQLFIGEILSAGAIAVDATVGNGGDTVFLARKVGATGKVYGFDIQEQAIEITTQKLKENQLLERVHLYRAGHEKMTAYIKPPVKAVMFNLGYLPGGDHNVITKKDTTLGALQQAVEILSPGGRVSVVAYTGHKGAEDEFRALEKYTSKLDNKLYSVIKLSFFNRKKPAPFLMLIEKEGFQ